MKIPGNYDTNKDYNSYESITPGGHKCVIKQVEETMSKTGKQMLVISFDMTEDDPQAHYYTNRYVNDKRPDKKWSGNMYLMLEGEYSEGNLNRFLGAVDHSNENFQLKPGADLDPRVFKNLKVGIVFREEEYTKEDGTVGYSVKGFRWCSYDNAFDQKIPERKVQQSTFQPINPNHGAIPPAGNDYGFVNVADGLEDEGLPFN